MIKEVGVVNPKKIKRKEAIKRYKSNAISIASDMSNYIMSNVELGDDILQDQLDKSGDLLVNKILHYLS